jgi:dihydropteroate synthase
MEHAGADILDLGGESTRPGSQGISAREEMARILPVLRKLRGRLKIPVAVDTSKAEVAEAAVQAGAELLNNVKASRPDQRLAAVARHYKVPLILMHMRGEPRTMQKEPFARDVIDDVTAGLRQAVSLALQAGVLESQIVLDPGIGFGKSYEQNFELLARLPELARLGFPVLIGTSRKGFIGEALRGAPTKDRRWGTAATVAASVLGGAHIVRVHDVEEMVQVVRVTDQLCSASGSAKRASSA